MPTSNENTDGNKDEVVEIYNFNNSYFNNLRYKAYAFRSFTANNTFERFPKYISLPIIGDAMYLDTSKIFYYDSINYKKNEIIRYAEDTKDISLSSSDNWPYDRIGFSKYFYIKEPVQYRAIEHVKGDYADLSADDPVFWNLMGYFNSLGSFAVTTEFTDPTIAIKRTILSATCYLYGEDRFGTKLDKSFLIGTDKVKDNDATTTINVYKSYKSMNEILQKCYTNTPDWDDKNDHRLAGVSNIIKNFRSDFETLTDVTLRDSDIGLHGQLAFRLNPRDSNELQIFFASYIYNMVRVFNPNDNAIDLYLHFALYNDMFDMAGQPHRTSNLNIVGCVPNNFGLKVDGPLEEIGHIRHIVVPPMSFYTVQLIDDPDLKLDISKMLTVEEMARIATDTYTYQNIGYKMNFMYAKGKYPEKLQFFLDAKPLIPNYLGNNNGGITPPPIIEDTSDESGAGK